MTSNDFGTAFKQLEFESLNEADFNLSSASKEDVLDYLNDDEADNTKTVIDIDAETEDDLDSDNVGKIILQCPCCNSYIVKKKEDIELPEDEEEATDELVQIDDQCPVCFSEEGYKIIGQVAPYEEVTVEIEKKDLEAEEELEDKSEEAEEFLVANNLDTDDDSIELIASVLNKIDSDTIQKLMELGCKECAEDESADDAIEDEEESDEEVDEDESEEEHDEDTEEEMDESLSEGKCRPVFMKKSCKNGVCECGPSEACENEQYLAERPEIPEEFIKKTDEITESKEEDTDEVNALVPEEESENESLTEGLNDIQLDTDTDHISIHAEAKNNGEEMIAPLDFQAANEIVDAQPTVEGADAFLDQVEPAEAPVEEMPSEDLADMAAEEIPEQEIEQDVDEVDEEAFDQLGESYLKEVYDNVTSYKTTSMRESKGQLVCEGLITFDSGKTYSTQFILEGDRLSGDGKCSMLVENAQITPGKRVMNMRGQLKDSKFIPESLQYNYHTNGTQVRGIVRVH